MAYVLPETWHVQEQLAAELPFEALDDVCRPFRGDRTEASGMCGGEGHAPGGQEAFVPLLHRTQLQQPPQNAIRFLQSF